MVPGLTFELCQSGKMTPEVEVAFKIFNWGGQLLESGGSMKRAKASSYGSNLRVPTIFFSVGTLIGVPNPTTCTSPERPFA